MRDIRIYIFLALSAISLTGCIETFYPSFEKYENLLVVDGLISNEPGPYTIFLSRSFPAEEKFPVPVEKALIRIKDDLGNITPPLTEFIPGTYKTEVDLFTGKEGRSYQLQIQLADESVYESTYELIRPAPEIDSLYWQYEEQYNRYNKKIPGIQFYLNSNDPENNTWYYRWEWEETWEFKTPYYIPEFNVPERCWKYDRSSDIFIHSSEDLSEDIITGYPIAFISGETDRLLVKYSLLVKQYSISRNAYLYWNKLKSTNQEIGGLYDPVPSFLPGNIRCTTREDEIVLGYFQASGVNKKRIFVGYDEIPPMRINKGFEYCDYAMVPNDSSLMAPYFNDDWIFIGIWSVPVGGGYIEMANFINSAACLDCSFTGDPKRPEYWID